MRWFFHEKKAEHQHSQKIMIFWDTKIYAGVESSLKDLRNPLFLVKFTKDLCIKNAKMWRKKKRFFSKRHGWKSIWKELRHQFTSFWAQFSIFCQKKGNVEKNWKTLFFPRFQVFWVFLSCLPSELDRASRSSSDVIICFKMFSLGVLDVF